MPAFVQHEDGGLLVTFSREGEDDDQRIADDGATAVSLAMRMLALRDELRPGDRLTIQANLPVEPEVTGGI
jgi:hypothetical protein